MTSERMLKIGPPSTCAGSASGSDHCGRMKLTWDAERAIGRHSLRRSVNTHGCDLAGSSDDHGGLEWVLEAHVWKFLAPLASLACITAT